MATADKDHLHHRLMRLGHGHRRSVLILWTWSLLLSGLVLYPVFTSRGNNVVPFAVAGLGLALYTLFHPGIRRMRPAAEASAESGPVAKVIDISDRDRTSAG